MSRTKNVNVPALDLRALDLVKPEDNTAELRAEAARNTRLLQIGRIDEMDRAALLSKRIALCTRYSVATVLG